MRGLSTGAIARLRGMSSEMMDDECEINPESDPGDGYASSIESYPHSGVVVFGSLQEVLRVPGTPEQGATTLVTGNFVIKLPADAPLPLNGEGELTQKLQIVVNGVGVYQVQNVYGEKNGRVTTSAYCYRVM